MRFFTWLADRTKYKRKATRFEKALKELKTEYNDLLDKAAKVCDAHTELEKENEDLSSRYRVWRDLYYSQLDENRTLESKLRNASGKEKVYVEKIVYRNNPNQVFTQEEIAAMIRFCHPDKHGGKESATRITQKLIGMRQR